MGNLIVNIGIPCDEREEVIVNLLDELCLVDLLCGYQLWTPCRTATRAQWTWSRKWGTTQHYLQPDYILAHTEETGIFMGMGFRFLWFLHSDHRAIIAVVRVGGEGRLKKYRRKRQKLLLSLPLGPKDAGTTALVALAAECVDPKPMRKPGKDWISKTTWCLIAKWASLLRSGRIWQDAAQRMKSKIGAAIKVDKQKLTTKPCRRRAAAQAFDIVSVPAARRRMPLHQRAAAGRPGDERCHRLPPP
jgi:hypothetical protein